MGLSNFTSYKSASIGLLTLLLPLSAFSQVTLTGTSYTENFNSIGSGLPNGWSVSTSATTSTLGTNANVDFVTTATNWNAGTGTAAFRNIASNNIAFDSSPTAQSENANRALGWRPVSAATRNGAVTLALTNTIGFTNFSLSFDLFTTNDVSASQTYVFEYRVGDSGNFSQVGSTYATSVSGATGFGSVTYSFISTDFTDLNDQSAAVYFRVRGTATSGTTGLDTIAIDNFSLTYSAVPEPSTFALLAGTATLGLAAFRRRTRPVKAANLPAPAV